MPVLRVLESVINPGKNAQWRQSAREVKDIVESEGGSLRFLQLMSGGNPSTVFGVSAFESMDDFGAFSDKMNSGTKLPEYMQRLAESEGFPFAEIVSVNVYRDLHDEVGEPSGMLENPEILAGFRQQLVPGRRADYIAMVKAVRDAMKSEGKPVGSSMQCVIGDMNIFTRAQGFASMAEWAAAQQAGFSDNVMGILQQAQADGPLFQSVESRLLRNITDSL